VPDAAEMRRIVPDLEAVRRESIRPIYTAMRIMIFECMPVASLDYAYIARVGSRQSKVAWIGPVRVLDCVPARCQSHGIK